MKISVFFRFLYLPLTCPISPTSLTCQKTIFITTLLLIP
nr:MAG TPA: hypothetical protein [Bacteriophage sp.]